MTPSGDREIAASVPAPATGPTRVRSLPATHHFVEVDGLRLHLLELGGQGDPILLLHGVGGQAWMWHAVAPALSGVGRVLALDLRGYGESQWSPKSAYSTDDHIADVEAVLAAVGLERVDVVGFSWGGLIGLGLADRRPDLVRRLVMIDIPPSTDRSATDVIPFASDFRTHEEAVEAQRTMTPRASRELLDVLAAFGTRPAGDGRLVRKHDPEFLERWPFRDDDLWDELGRVPAPLLLVHAAESHVLGDADANRMVAAAPDARLTRIERSAHQVHLEQPEALARALTDFLGA